jgi:hypothetical protein
VANETMLIGAWLKARLGANATITSQAAGQVYDDPPVTPTATYPFVSCEFFSAEDDPCFDSAYAGSQLWLVEAWGNQRSYGPLVALANAIEAELREVPPVVFGGQVYQARRRRPWRQAQEVDGKPYRRLGSFFDVYVETAS